MRSPATALLAAALVAYVLIWPQAPVTEGDSPQYLAVARDLSDGRLDDLHDRTPGYPLLLALTGSTEAPTRALFVTSLILHLLSVWMLAGVFTAAGAGKTGGFALVALLLLPPYVEPAGYVMTEALAQTTLVAGFACLMAWVVRPRVWLVLLAAVVFALAGLTRPTFQALTPLLAACLLVVPRVVHSHRITIRKAGVAASVLVAASMLVLGGYAYANRVAFGFFGVTHTVGFHLSTKTMSFVERLPEEYAAVREILVRERDAQLTKRGGPHTGTQAIWSARSELAAATGLDMPGLSRYLLWMNLRLIARAPVEYLQAVARSMADYWFPIAGPLATMNSSVLRWSWAILHALLLAAFVLQLMVLAGVLLFQANRRMASGTAPSYGIRASEVQALAYVLAGAIVCYNMLLSCFLDIGEPRQRRATEALFVFTCILGLHLWRQSAAGGRPVGHDA